MNIKDLIKARHSVRQFKDISIEESIREKLNNLAIRCNEDSGLNIQVIYDDPDCFNSLIAHYGKFENVTNYIALVGRKSLDNLEELCGYYGERMVLMAQELGLNTCWVGGTYSKGKCKADKQKGEKIVCVIALGYGKGSGVKHKSKKVGDLCNVAEEDMPIWFKNGMVAAMLAPTAINQQKFLVTLKDDEEVIITPKKGPFAMVDLGIVKYHFEAVTGRKCK
ncbi:MAG: nitroreductase family protein [Eubacterium sp.]|nr:nitroreductase family protein [Eubacterium sp.]